MNDLDLNAGALAPVADEVDVPVARVHGKIPEGLAGTLIRNGPNPLDGRFHGQGVLDWWPEAAMLHAVSITADGRCAYRNRWVRTRRWQAHHGATDAGGWVDSNPNVNVLHHAGEILALAEGGPPVAVDAHLDTLGAPVVHAPVAAGMTAHPKVEPESSELSYVHLGPAGLRYGVLDPAGHRVVDQAVTLTGRPGMMHDMAITATRAVLMDLGVGFDFSMLERGFRLPVCWQPERGSRLGVLPRRGGPVRWLEIEPCFIQHVVNAWDSGPHSLVFEAVRYPHYFRPDGSGGFLRDSLGVLWRYEIDLARGSVAEGPMGERSVELPRIDERRTGRRHRYVYSVAQPTDQEMRGVVQLDVDSGAERVHAVAPGDQNSEAVFVADPAGRAEDDGWLLVCVYRGASDSSELRILDARDPAEVLATVTLGRRIPAGFHGAWIPA